MKRLHEWSREDVESTLPDTLIYTEDIATQSNPRAGIFTIYRTVGGLEAAIAIAPDNPACAAIETAAGEASRELGWVVDWKAWLKMARKGPVLLRWERERPWLPLDVLNDAQEVITAFQAVLQIAETHLGAMRARQTSHEDRF